MAHERDGALINVKGAHASRQEAWGQQKIPNAGFLLA